MLGLAPLNDKFWRWFGRSVIRTTAGDPMVVYHGTRSSRDFSRFETGTIFDRRGNVIITGSSDPGAYLGPHFAEDPALASKFASGKAAFWDQTRVIFGSEAGGRVIPVYLHITNPMVFESDEEMIEFIFAHGESHTLDDQLMYEFGDEDGEVDFEGLDFEAKENAFQNLSTDDENMKEMAAEELGASVKLLLERQGYDGVVYVNTIEGHGLSFIPFSAPQIKSASGNRGTWSPRRDDIRE